MKASFLLLHLALVTRVAMGSLAGADISILRRQDSGLSPCVTNCVAAAAISAGCTTDALSCLCGNVNFQTQTTNCLVANCTTAEVTEITQIFGTGCGAALSSSILGGLTNTNTRTSAVSSTRSTTHTSGTGAATGNSNNNGGGGGTNVALIAGVVGGVVALLLIAGGILVCVCYKRKKAPPKTTVYPAMPPMNDANRPLMGNTPYNGPATMGGAAPNHDFNPYASSAAMMGAGAGAGMGMRPDSTYAPTTTTYPTSSYAPTSTGSPSPPPSAPPGAMGQIVQPRPMQPIPFASLTPSPGPDSSQRPPSSGGPQQTTFGQQQPPPMPPHAQQNFAPGNAQSFYPPAGFAQYEDSGSGSDLPPAFAGGPAPAGWAGADVKRPYNVMSAESPAGGAGPSAPVGGAGAAAPGGAPAALASVPRDLLDRLSPAQRGVLVNLAGTGVGPNVLEEVARQMLAGEDAPPGYA